MMGDFWNEKIISCLNFRFYPNHYKYYTYYTSGIFSRYVPNITIDDNLTYNRIIPLYSSPVRIILHVFCKSSKEQAAFAGLVDGSISISILVFGWIYF